MSTSANICLLDGYHEYWFHRDRDGFLAVVGADLIQVYEGMVEEHRLLSEFARTPSGPVGAFEIAAVLRCWPQRYRPIDHVVLCCSDALFLLDLGRPAGDYFGHAETSEFQRSDELTENVQWFTLAQFKAQVNDERAFFERALTTWRTEEPGAYPGAAFPPV